VGKSAVSKMSLMPTGSPRNGARARLPAVRHCGVLPRCQRGERADLGLARGDRLGAKLGYGARGEVAGVDPAS
jgi:hypothetical protein